MGLSLGIRSRLGAWRRRGRVGIWYHREYAAPGLETSSRVEHVDLHRGERIIGALVEERILRPVDVRTSPLASVGQLRRFHSLAHIEAVESPDVLGRIFGLPSDEVDVESLLQASKRAVGGTVVAMHEAAERRLEVAVNLGGGFHHAEPELGSGFCVFNDIGVGIADLRRSGWTGRVAIVDLDFHQGNGNTVAFAADPTVFVYSLHGANWTHVEPTGYERQLSGPVDDRRYLGELRTTLETTLRRFRPHLVVYIAGADVLAGDRLGSFWVSARGVFERDLHVLDVTRSLRVPLVVTLGGGYSPEAWRAHHRFARALLTGRRTSGWVEPPSLRSRFAEVASSLDERELRGESGPDDFQITEADIFGDLGVRAQTRRFLDYYSEHGVEVAFERYGILDAIRKRGFTGIEMEVDPSDPLRQLVRVWGRMPGGGPRALLVELVSRRAYVPSFVEHAERLEMLCVEWLLLQDPSRSFSLARPKLPGQEHPGLGLSQEVQELLVQACHRLGLAGLMDRPSHYHNAVIAKEWSFVDPKLEGRFRAFRTALEGLDLFEATRLVDDVGLTLSDGTQVGWEAGDHCLPVDVGVRAYFRSKAFEAAASAEETRLLEAGLSPSVS